MAYTESFYQGQFTPFDSEYSPAHQMRFADLGTSQDARTADQVKETSKHLNTGIRTFEVAAHSPEVFEAMPKDQLKEINRLAKLTGSEATIHAPMVDPVGIVQDRWDETAQKSAERQLWNAVEKSHDLNPSGNTVVTFHASTAQLPPAEMKIKDGKKIEIKSLLFIGPQNKINQIKQEVRFFPTKEGKKPEGFNPVEELERENKEAWIQQLNSLNYYAEIGERGVAEANKLMKYHKGETINEIKQNWPKVKDTPEMQKLIQAGQVATPEMIEKALSHGGIYLRDSYRNLKNLYDMAYKNCSEEERGKLNDYATDLKPYLKDFEDIDKKPEKLSDFSKMIERGLKVLEPMRPKLFQPLREFAVKKSADTVSNLALKSYNKFGNTAPIISVENHPAGQSLLTTGEDLKDVVEAARNQFVEKAVKEGKLSAGEAKDQAKKLIGATWDVGHINMLRRFGFEKKDIIEETEKVAPFVKHVHLSDNFGFEHTELPMGMGNVPLKEIMGKLGKEGFKGKQIVEALSWWQHFSDQGRQHAIVPTLQNISSPIYGMQNAPYWNQAMSGQMDGGYMGSPMAYLPEKHFSTYGTGFGSLPQELGGQIPGTQSRFSGTPNA